ncbi:hypothetical protein HanRHA438_Chr17g0841901 [Helianthus annuus]|nr:hypothetical protein HanRHA438_Chr17g0841901 [Helianthus annuus]
MGARKDLAKSFSRMTQEEVDLFCMEWGIGRKFKPVAPACDKSINQCPPGWIALYCRHFEFSNLRHPFSNFVLNILEYYRVSFCQIHPLGMAKVLHFEILCRASGYDPSLLSFRRFFRLAKNGDWFTFETTQVDTCLISSMVSTLGVWKDRFFWVSEEIVHFKLVWRHPDAVLNEPAPSASDINTRFLETLRECPSRPIGIRCSLETGRLCLHLTLSKVMIPPTLPLMMLLLLLVRMRLLGVRIIGSRVLGM